MSKFAVVAIVTAFTTISSVTNAQANPPCNPASWCHPRSLLCKSEEDIKAILSGQDGGVSNEVSRGVCTDAYRWFCNDQGFRCQRQEYTLEGAWERCKIILNTDKRNRDKFYNGMYVEACRDGEYTCKNGLCTLNPADCQKMGGIRYSNKRCARDECGGSNLLKDTCTTESIPSEGAQECVDQPAAQLAPCCPSAVGGECRALELANSGDLTLRQCGGECPAPTCAPTNPTAQPSSPPVSSPTLPPAEVPPFEPATVKEYPPNGITVKMKQEFVDRDCCCKLSCDCFGDPHCTNFFGEQQTSKVESGSFDMFRNREFSITPYLGAPQGIIRKIVVETKKRGSSETIALELNINFCHNRTHNWMKVRNDEGVPPESLPAPEFVKDIPENWDFDFSLDGSSGFVDPNVFRVRDPRAQLLAEIKCQKFFWSDSPTDIQRVYTRLDVVVTAWRDKVVKEETGEICCPSQAENEIWILLTGASGYCVNAREHGIPGGNNNPPPTRRMMLSDKENDAIQKAAQTAAATLKQPKRQLYGFSAEKTASIKEKMLHEQQEAAAEIQPRRDLSTVAELCDEYLRLVAENGTPSIFDNLDDCLANIGDFGAGSLESLITLLRTSTTSCISDVQDPRLPGPNGLRACEQGVILQVKLQGTDEWINLQSFPAGLPYCQDAVTFYFERFEISEGRFLTENDTYRIFQCAPDTETCGVCLPLQEIADYGFSYVHECAAYENYKELLKVNLLNSMKAGKIVCGLRYLGSEDPLECIKDSRLRSFFY